jgi:hypothetical protein
MNPVLRYLLTKTLVLIIAFIFILFAFYILFNKNIEMVSKYLEERMNLLKEKERAMTQLAESIKLKSEIEKIESTYGIKISDLKNKVLNVKKISKGELIDRIKSFLSNSNIKILEIEERGGLEDSFSFKIESRLEDIETLEKFIKDSNLNIKIVNINIQPLKGGGNIIKIDFQIF